MVSSDLLDNECDLIDSSSDSCTYLDISVFGLGKVGLTLVSCLAAAGHRVIGVDVNHHLVSAVKDHTAKSDEPGVADRIKLGKDRLTATINSIEAIQATTISFVIVPTPSNTLGGFSLRYVLEACDVIGQAIRTKKGHHVVSLVSTVLPGSSDHIIIPRLEQASGRKIGQGLGYCYNPSFIALGEIVKGMERPDYILIGETDQATGDLVLAAHRAMIDDKTPIARMRPIEAEITKLASNTHETMRVSFANMLLAACSEIPGANVDRVTEALSHRMGKRFFKGAIPFGGPCWPRDNKALAVFLEAIGVPSRMPRNIDLFNEEHGRYILRNILELSKPGSKIGIIGLAYKPGTPVIERSYAVDLIQWLNAERRAVISWDPLAMGEVHQVVGDKVKFASSGDACIKEASLIVVINPLKELAVIDWANAKDKTVVDCWRCLTPAQRENIGHYVPLGEGRDNDEKTWIQASLCSKLDLLTT